jgi:O-antigen/teichoic acid export membrane protein
VVATRVLGQGLEFLAFVLFARELGPTDFGALAVAFLVARYVGLLADWGAASGGARDIARDPDEAHLAAFLRQRTLSGAVGALAFVAVAATLRPEIMPVGAVVLAAGLNREWVALGRGEAARAGAPSIVRGAVLLGCALFASSLTSSSASLAFAYVAGAIASVAVAPLSPSRGATGGWRLAAGWLMIATVAAQIYSTADVAMLGWLRSEREAGVYAAVYRIPNAWVTVTGLAVAAFVPVAARAIHHRPEAVLAIGRRAWRVGIVLAAALLALVPIAAWAVVPIFGSAYEEGRWPLVLLLVANAVASVTAPVGAVYLASGSDRVFAAALCVGAFTNVVGNIIVIPRAGMSGAAWTTLAAEVVVLVILGLALQARMRVVGAAAG